LARYVGSLDVNAEQVKRGMAWVYRKYARDQALFALEQEAKSAKRGLWADPHAIPPWESRQAAEQTPQQKANPHKPWARQAAIINAALSAIATRWPLAKKPGSI
jgi:endonuclease YncB( thermonuclease family)